MASLVPPNSNTRNYGIKFYFKGKQFQRSLKVSNKRDAISLKQKIERQLAEGRLDPTAMLQSSASTLFEFSKTYTDYLDSRSKRYSEKVRDTYKDSLRILKNFFGDTDLHNILPRLIETKFLPYLEEQYAPHTVVSHMTRLRAIFSFTVKWKLLAENPFSKLVPPRPDKLPVYFKKEDIQKIKDYFENPNLRPWYRPFFILLLNTGLRKSKLLGLRWSKNVFLDEKLIKFPGKGERERLVPLNDECLNILRQMRRRLGNDKVFYQVASASTVDSAWYRIRERLGLPFKIHHFRSNYASWYMMNGGNIYDLMQILGWEDYSTAKIYLSHSKEHIESKRNIVQF